MTTKIANAARTRYAELIKAFLETQGEDCAFVTSNTFNMPFVQDGEEGVIEITVKVTKKEYDESMQEREDYTAKLEANAEKAAEREKAAKERKAKADAKAAEKAAKKAEKEAK